MPMTKPRKPRRMSPRRTRLRRKRTRKKIRQRIKRTKPRTTMQMGNLQQVLTVAAQMQHQLQVVVLLTLRTMARKMAIMLLILMLHLRQAPHLPLATAPLLKGCQSFSREIAVIKTRKAASWEPTRMQITKNLPPAATLRP